MEKSNNSTAWQYDSKEQEALAQHIIGLEKSAIDKFFNGDMSGYRHLWSKNSFSYFDALTKERVEKFSDMLTFLDNLEGKLKASDYQILSPRVQFGVDMAILTFQLFAHTNFSNIEYNCIEVFQKEADGEWHVIHSTWSTIRPMDKYGKKVEETL